MDKILKTKHVKSCLMCDKEHDIELREYPADVIIHGIKVNYVEQSYYCKNTDQYFASGKLVDENLARAREAYKELQFDYKKRFLNN